MPYGTLAGARNQSRDPAFGPAQIPALAYLYLGGYGMYQTAGGAAASADNDPLGQWQDLSGLGRHLAQATAGSRPFIRTGGNGLDGRTIVSSDTTPKYASATLALSTVWTHLWVCRKRTVPDATLRVLGGTTSSNSQIITRSSISAAGWVYTNNQAASSNVLGGTANAWQILARRHNATNSCECWQDGAAFTLFDPSDTYSTNNTLFLGAGSAGVSPGDYDFAALVGYTAALTNAQINSLAGYLRGLFPSLPAWAAI